MGIRGAVSMEFFERAVIFLLSYSGTDVGIQHLNLNPGTVCISARTARTSKTVRFPYRQGLHNKKGETLQPNYLTRRWNKFVKQHGLRAVRLHDLRHTTAGLMLMNGTDVKVLAEILGHKDVAVTLNTYSHVASEQKLNALITLGALCDG